MKVCVVGAGPGDAALLTGLARERLMRCDRVLTNPRLKKALGHLNPNTVACPLSETAERILKAGPDEQIGVLVSGDVGFYSLSSTLRARLGGEADIEYVNGLSSLQYLASRLGISYEDIRSVSAHGRADAVVPLVSYNRRIFVFTGGQRRAGDIAAELAEAGLGEVPVMVGENLSGPEERILSDTAGALAGRDFADLAVMLVENPAPADCLEHLADHRFVRGAVPMTKESVRWLALALMNVRPRDVVWDIGAGTGSVSVELARAACEGTVCAVERDAEALPLLAENRRRLGAYNMRVVEAEAPEGLEKLPPPDRVFIGGSGGHLRQIVRAALDKNPAARLVIGAVTLDTLEEACACLKDEGLEADVRSVGVTHVQRVGGYRMLKAQNPVWLIAGGKADG
jgi:precorrin-6Y C5,15-methyltransferase (decarboxylating)